MADGQGFAIDPAGVKDFSKKLQTGVDKDLTPMAARIKADLTWYPIFGLASGSPAVQEAARTYVGQVNGGLAFLDTLARNTSTMAQAAADVVKAYQMGDDLSAVEMNAVLAGASKVVNDAADAAKKAQQDAEEQASLDERRFLRQNGMR